MNCPYHELLGRIRRTDVKTRKINELQHLEPQLAFELLIYLDLSFYVLVFTRGAKRCNINNVSNYCGLSVSKLRNI